MSNNGSPITSNWELAKEMVKSPAFPVRQYRRRYMGWSDGDEAVPKEVIECGSAMQDGKSDQMRMMDQGEWEDLLAKARKFKKMERAFKCDNWRVVLEVARELHEFDVTARYYLGFCYEYGYGVEKKPNEAYMWFLNAAEHGHVEAQAHLGGMYYDGRGVEKDYGKSYSWICRSANAGSTYAMRYFGHMYKTGNSVSKVDLKEASKWYRKGADRGDAEAAYEFARMCYPGDGIARDLIMAKRYYKLAKDNGYPHAWIALDMYLGEVESLLVSTAKNAYKDADSERFVRYANSTDLKDGELVWNLAICYRDGKGIEKDAQRAAELFEKAEKLGWKPMAGNNQTKEPIDELNAMIGLAPVKDEVEKIIAFQKMQKVKKANGLPVAVTSNHLVFTGNPGTGKTTVARIIAKAFHEIGVIKTDKCVEVDRSKLCAEYVGQTAPKTLAVCQSALDGVLFIDEAYTLNGGGTSDYGKEAVDTLLKYMEDNRDRIVVIVAGYEKEMKDFINMNPGLQSRFSRYIHFPDYSAEELTQIVDGIAKKQQLKYTPEVRNLIKSEMDKAVAEKDQNFSNGRFARNFFDRVLERQSARLCKIANPTVEELTEIRAEDVGVQVPTVEEESESNPYDMVGVIAESDSGKAFHVGQLVDTPTVRHAAYMLATEIRRVAFANDGQDWQTHFDMAVFAAYYVGIGASVDYKLNPVAFDIEKTYRQCDPDERDTPLFDAWARVKLGALATPTTIRQLDELCQDVLGVTIDFRDEEGIQDEDDRLPGFVHRACYAAFIVGFTAGTNLQRDGVIEIHQNGVSVRIGYARHLHLSLAENGRSFISNISVKNIGRKALEACACKVTSPEGFFAESTTQIGKISAEGVFESGPLPISLSVAAMSAIETTKPGNIRLQIVSDGHTLFEHDYALEAVSPRHTHDIVELPDLMAAYVVPHCAEVKELVKSAAEILRLGTGDSSFDGYQKDRERVHHQCHALYDALCKKYLTYAPSPADIGLPGQKIRLPDEIMKYKTATCMDTTFLLAAAVESVGLHPLVILIRGHAYLGVFLSDRILKEPTMCSPEALQESLDANDLILIETTGVCRNVNFDAVVAAGAQRFRDTPDADFECVLDVCHARHLGVKQLSIAATSTLGGPVSAQAPHANIQQGGALAEVVLGAMGKPSALMYDGKKVASATSWKELFEVLFVKLAELNMSEFAKLPDDPYFSKYFVRIVPGKKYAGFYKEKLGTNADVRAKELSNKVYLWREDYYVRKLITRLNVSFEHFEVV